MTQRRTAALLLVVVALLVGACTGTETAVNPAPDATETQDDTSGPPATGQPDATEARPTTTTSLAGESAILRLAAFDFGPDLEVRHNTPFSPKKEGAEMMGGCSSR
jgi:hypothetical protein